MFKLLEKIALHPLFTPLCTFATLVLLTYEIIINFYRNKPNISIILFPREIEKIIYNDRVFLGFDKDNILCSIEVKNMPEDEWALLEESLGLRPHPIVTQ